MIKRSHNLKKTNPILRCIREHHPYASSAEAIAESSQIKGGERKSAIADRAAKPVKARAKFKNIR